MSAYTDASARARQAIFGEGEVPRETLRVLVKAAHDLAPDDEQRAIWDRYTKALQDGHRLAVKTYAMSTVTVDGTPVELIQEVEAIFDNEESDT